jgi:hypothetical protein
MESMMGMPIEAGIARRKRHNRRLSRAIAIAFTDGPVYKESECNDAMTFAKARF